MHVRAQHTSTSFPLRLRHLEASTRSPCVRACPGRWATPVFNTLQTTPRAQDGVPVCHHNTMGCCLCTNKPPTAPMCAMSGTPGAQQPEELSICTLTATQFSMIPSQLSEHTRSHRHAEVKHLCAELVLWWVTTGEASVRDCFALLLHQLLTGKDILV